MLNLKQRYEVAGAADKQSVYNINVLRVITLCMIEWSKPREHVLRQQIFQTFFWLNC